MYRTMLTQSKSILLVEDSKSFGAFVKKRIEDALDIPVVWVQTCAEAITTMESSKKPFLLGVLDMVLPDAANGEIVDVVLAKGIPGIVLTGQYTKGLRDITISKGVIDFFIKDNIGVVESVIRFIDRFQKNHDVRILIVDDSRGARLFLRRFLEGHGFIILEAENGSKAIEVLNTVSVQLMIVDFQMPGMDGCQLTQTVRKRYSIDEISIIGLSSVNKKDLAVRFIKAGANDFLQKPFLNEELLWRIIQNIEIHERRRELEKIVVHSNRQSASRMTINKLLETALASMSITKQLETALDHIFLVPWFSLLSKGAIFLVDSVTGELTLQAHRGFSEYQVIRCGRIPPGMCLCGKVLQEAKTLFVDHVDEQHHIQYEQMADHGHFVVPINSNEKVIGVIVLYVQANHIRKQEEDEFLGVVAFTLAGLIERKKLEERVKQQSEYDELTGLPNRTLFQSRLTRTLQRANLSNTEVILMFLDLDRFKFVNDTMGHKAGDSLLRDAAKRILECVRNTDTVARLGGDEFTIILPKLTSLFYVEFVARRILEELSKPFQLPGGQADISGSIGIAVFPNDASDMDRLIKSADTAMYHAKRAGRATFRFFEEEMNANAMKRLEMEKAIQHALKNNEFLLYYQPKIDTCSGQITGMEALARWNRPTLGFVSPNEFIPIAELTGLIVPLGDLVLEMACRQNKKWLDLGFSPLCVSVNLSTVQLKQGDRLVSTIKGLLSETGLSAEYLEIEITESMMMEDMDNAIDILNQVRALGVKISVDDFGTGYSSLGSLKNLPVQTFKIDRSFIFELMDDQDSVAIVSAIISMAKQLNLRVVAEGVERKEQVEFLKIIGCDEIQGFFYSKPLAPEEFERYIETYKTH